MVKEMIRWTIKGLIYSYALSSIKKNKASVKDAEKISNEILEASRQVFCVGLLAGKEGMDIGLQKAIKQKKKLGMGINLLVDAGMLNGE